MVSAPMEAVTVLPVRMDKCKMRLPRFVTRFELHNKLILEHKIEWLLR